MDGRAIRDFVGLFRLRAVVPESVAVEQLDRGQGTGVHDNGGHGGRLLRDIRAVRWEISRV